MVSITVTVVEALRYGTTSSRNDRAVGHKTSPPPGGQYPSVLGDGKQSAFQWPVAF
jgi:hypothetical protein